MDAPLTTQPLAIRQSQAWPRASGASNTNFAGGRCSSTVRIGHAASYMLSSGSTRTRSMFADQ
jgi:hypothetical protein